ncbi:hypothetical protein GPECTOR_59g660 [Gonium pectorale]|uniref:Uncharacterized protein n=1 Tax=Gonium pectorale TaxID=33097 RepID=A0A150G5C0_GONPE|nr:hypothetical protein GPECTOR_59g660 [Gonium pectorale]|eukprot:KXZ45052.1 hypothetical protein GPECTOR_59g660 [Gonium pectorale]
MSAAPEQPQQYANSACSSHVWSQLLPELAEKIVGCLDPNEVPSFRLVNKAAAAQFRAPRHTTYRLSQPVPPHVFAAHWLAPGITRGLTLHRRWQLLSLTAASGVVANLELGVQAAGCLLTPEVLEAAAGAGQLDSCIWLWEHGCPTGEYPFKPSSLLAAAASGGHRHVCEWLLGQGLTGHSNGAVEAARGGHVGLMEWLLQRRPALNVETYPEHETPRLVAGVAHGCDLPTLQRLWRRWGEVTEWAKATALEAAAGSPTPDWAAKVEWLEAQGCPRSSPWPAAECPDAVARLAWLRARGFPFELSLANIAAKTGNVVAVQYLLGEAGVQLSSYDAVSVVAGPAAGFGHLAVLQALHGGGWSSHAAGGWPRNIIADCARTAASHGHLHVLTWLVGTFGAEAVGMDPSLFKEAAFSGSVDLMTWLQERGCGWSREALTAAACSGCEEAVEWLVAQGCPVEDGYPSLILACRNGDLAMAQLLRQLGAPWGPAGSVVSDAAERSPLPMLRWLLQEGCPLGDYDAAWKAAAERVSGRQEALELLEAHRQAQEREAFLIEGAAGGVI